MSEVDLKHFLSIAKEAAILAGEYLLEGSHVARRVNKEFEHDVKIEADIQSEKIIIEFLEQHSDFSIISEEKGKIQRKNQDYVWIVDPVDGSLNYSRQIPLCCISVGLWRGDEPILGVIYDFNQKELFSAIVGTGAWKNDECINVSSTKSKQNGILLTGFPVSTDFSSPSIQNFIENIRTFKKVRLLGSAALSIAYVACGRADIYHEKDIMIWDVAGGIPLVLGAGGDIQIEKTSKPDCINVCVTNALINQKSIVNG